MPETSVREMFGEETGAGQFSKFPQPWDFEVLHKISQCTLLCTFMHNLLSDAVHVTVTVV